MASFRISPSLVLVFTCTLVCIALLLQVIPTKDSLHTSQPALQPDNRQFQSLGPSPIITSSSDKAPAEIDTLADNAKAFDWTMALDNGLTADQLNALAITPAEGPAQSLTDAPAQVAIIIDKILVLEHSVQRLFLVDLIKAADRDIQAEAARRLLGSHRAIDRLDAVALVMQSNEIDEKHAVALQLLQAEKSNEVIVFLLKNVAQGEHEELSQLLASELLTLVEYSELSEAKSLALKAVMKNGVNTTQVIDKAIEWLNVGDDALVKNGLGILFLQINDYGASLTPDQQRVLINELDWIIQNKPAPEPMRQAKAVLSLIDRDGL